MPTPVWSRYPLLSMDQHARSWLTLLGRLGRAAATVDAYGRGFSLSHAVEHRPGLATAARVIFGREVFEAAYGRLAGALAPPDRGHLPDGRLRLCRFRT